MRTIPEIPYRVYRREHGMPDIPFEEERRIEHAIRHILESEESGLILDLQNIYSNFPPIDEGLHQLEEMGIYTDNLKELVETWQKIMNLIVQLDGDIEYLERMSMIRYIRDLAGTQPSSA